MKVISYNISMGGEDRLPQIAALLRAEQPDAVALLEANDHTNAATLARDLGMAFAFGEANCDCHIAWLSNLPILSATNHQHPALAKTLLEIELGWSSTTLHLFATHLASRHEPPEPADEIPIILSLLAPLADRPQLLVGDFNALRPDDPADDPPPGVTKRGDARDNAPRLAIRRLLDAGYTDCYRILHPHDPGYTYPTNAPWLRLDYHFASPSLAPHLEACGIIASPAATQASDHFPVWTSFR